MNTPDHATFREWLNLEVDGRLGPELKARFDAHLAGCAECQGERADLLSLHDLLARERLPVRPELRQSVLAALPPSGWEARAVRAWRFPAAAFALLAAAAAWAAGAVKAHGTGSSALGTAQALLGLLRGTVLAGAGLLGASWKGIGLVVSQVTASPLSLAAFALLVLCLDLLLVALLRRRRAAVDSRVLASRRTDGDRSDGSHRP